MPEGRRGDARAVPRSQFRSTSRDKTRGSLTRLLPRVLLLLCLLLGGFGAAVASAAPTDRVLVLEVRGAITPTVASYLDRGISEAERREVQAVLIELDTPGGLDDSTRKIMQRIIASKVPVVVYVYPSGGRAASAGLFVTQAAHVAAMAPDTNIGSAHPVQIGGAGGAQPAPDKTMTEKIENDAVAILRSITQTRGRNADWVEQAVRQSVNVPAREALELRVVDVVADSPSALLAAIDGRTVALAGGGTATLQTRDAATEPLEMTFAERIIQAISDPNLAYLLLTIGMYGLIYELANPGTWIPGVVGTIALLLALYSLGMLPVNWAAVGLIGLAFVLFAADVLVASGHGALTAAGIIALLLGSLFLFSGGSPELQLSPWVIAGVVGTTAAFFVFVVGAVYRSLRRRPTVGGDAMIGQLATVSHELAPRGTVELLGELWRAELVDGTPQPLPPGRRVQVVSVDGLTLKVRPST
jgi:membrane-bound serine protease (ClpP class)